MISLAVFLVLLAMHDTNIPLGTIKKAILLLTCLIYFPDKWADGIEVCLKSSEKGYI